MRDDKRSFPAADRWFRIGEVTALLGLSEATIYRMLAQGEFPQPVRISSRTVRWRESVMRKWMQERERAPAV